MFPHLEVDVDVRMLLEGLKDEGGVSLVGSIPQEDFRGWGGGPSRSVVREEGREEGREEEVEACGCSSAFYY